VRDAVSKHGEHHACPRLGTEEHFSSFQQRVALLGALLSMQVNPALGMAYKGVYKSAQQGGTEL